MITFTVGNDYMGYSTYNAEEGMTFADFANSQYNDGTITLQGNQMFWTYNSSPYEIMNVKPTTVIVNGKGYGTSVSG
jgi:hypothetical protein